MSLLTALLLWLQIVLGLTPACQTSADSTAQAPPSACAATPSKRNAAGYASPAQINNGF